jgi:hypothetical protein
MTDDLGPAVNALQHKLDEQLQAIADTKRTINMLLKMSGQPPLYPETDGEHTGAVRADQFYGKGLATCAAEYLAMRKQACPPREILRGLEAGGFDFDILKWKPEDRLRHLASSLAKNTGSAGRFHRLKNNTFGLRSWYDEDFLKKASSSGERMTKKPKHKAVAKGQTAKSSARPNAGAAKPAAIRTEKSQDEAKAN